MFFRVTPLMVMPLPEAAEALTIIFAIWWANVRLTVSVVAA